MSRDEQSIVPLTNLIALQANVLIDKSLNVRLADFGLSVLVKSATSTMANPLPDGGTTRFMAPELFLHMSHLNPSESVVNLFSAELSHLAPAVDIYAFACLCIEVRFHILCTGHYPITTAQCNSIALLWESPIV